MAVAFVQQGLANPGSGSQGTTFNVVLPGGMATGGTLVLAVAYSAGIPSVTGCGATWTQKVTNTDSSAAALVDIWIGTGGTAGQTTVTVNFSGTTLPVMNLSEWSGVLSVKNPTGTANASATSATTPGQTPVSGEAVYGIVAINTTGGRSISSNTDTPSAWTSLTGGSSSWMTYTLAPADITGVTVVSSRQGNFSGAATSITQSLVLSPTAAGATARHRSAVVVGTAITRSAVR